MATYQSTHTGAQIDAAVDAVSGKADKTTTLAGYGITDAYTKTQVDTALSGYLPLSGGTITENLTVNKYTYLGRTLYTTDSANNVRNTLNLDSNNNLQIGYGTAGVGYNTYLLGNNIYLRYGTSRTIGFIFNSSGNVGIGTTAPSQKLHVNGVVKCTSVDTSSDERMKNKVGDIIINVEDIANAPNVTFKWKEGEDTENIHGGTFAQYWEKITPYYVHGDEEKSMDYASLSLSCAIELAKEVVQLKEQNAMLKQELAEIKEMLKKLL